MDIEKKCEIYRAAVKKYGRVGQILKAIEELSELARALARDLPLEAPVENEVNVCEEIADVEIMLNQLWLLYDCDEITEWRESKLERLARMVGVEIGKEGGDEPVSD